MPTGDADSLRADVDDGHARVANLLLEALCVAPFTASQYAVTIYIIRRTYGWARTGDRSSGKMVQVTADEISDATGLPVSTVRKSIQGLMAAKVLLGELEKAGGPWRYGINPDIAAWGTMTVEWSSAKRQLLDARDRGLYGAVIVKTTRRRAGKPSEAPSEETPTPIQNRTPPLTKNGHPPDQKWSPPYPKMDTPLTKNGHPPNQKWSGVSALSPTGSGAQGTPTDICTDICTAICTPIFTPCAPACAVARTKWDEASTPEAKLALRAWEVFGLPDKPPEKLYKSLARVVKQYGLEICLEWLSYAQETGMALPEGADPGEWLPSQLRAQCRPTMCWKWQQERSERNPFDGPGTAARLERGPAIGPAPHEAFGEVRK